MLKLKISTSHKALDIVEDILTQGSWCIKVMMQTMDEKDASSEVKHIFFNFLNLIVLMLLIMGL